MPRLGEVLLSEKVLTGRELDSALENHVLHGVKLGTCLVEMGYVTDDELARCLAIQTGYPFLTKDQLMLAGNRYLSQLAPTVIKKYRIIPVGMQRDTLSLAIDHDLTHKKQQELEKFIGRKIEPVVVSGYAMDLFLEQIFGIPRPGRFLPRFSKTAAVTPSEAVETISKETGPVIINGVEWKDLGEVTQAEDTALLYDELYSGAMQQDEYPRSLSDAAERLSKATSRDDVAKAVLAFLSGFTKSSALLMIKDATARGWKASSNKKSVTDFESYSAPMITLPELQLAVVTKKPCVVQTMTPGTQAFFNTIQFSGGPCAFFPIFVQHKVVAALFCDAIESLNSIQITELCQKASYALEILILRSKLLRS